MSNWTLAIPKADLAARKVSNGDGTDVDLPESKEEAEGAYVPYHYDPHSSNHFDTNAYPCFLPVVLHPIKPACMGGRYELTWDANRCNVWPDRNRDPNTKLHPSHSFCATDTTVLYVEGTSLGTNLFTINWTDGTNTITDLDRVNVDVFCWEGPLNVPDYSIHRYTATGAPGKFENVEKGEIRARHSDTDVKIHWNKPPFPNVGKAVYRVNNNYTWDLGVNLVEVKIETPPNGKAFAVTGSPVDWRKRDFTINGRVTTYKQVLSAFGDSAVKWAAQVTLTGPNGGKGVDRMRVGFIQNLLVSECRGEYTNNTVKLLVSNMEKHSYLDYPANTQCAPYYSFGKDGNVFFSPSSIQNTKTISAEDTPRAGVPLYYLQSTNLQANDDIVDRMRVFYEYQLFITARTTDDVTTSTNEIYTVRARTTWSFNATGTIDQAGEYLWRNSNGIARNRGRNSWEPIIDGSEPPITGGTPFNDTAGSITWESPR